MRILAIATLSLLSVAQLWAQDKDVEDPPVLVIKYSWEKLRLNWEKDPLTSPTGENYYEMRTRVGTERRQRSALEEKSINAAREEKQKPTPPAKYVFQYKVKVQNAGSQAIKELDWDYIFIDSVTGEVLGRREFTSLEKIAPGKVKELVITVSAPPTDRISVYSLGKKEREGLVEKLEVRRIMYDDGSIWQPDSKRRENP